MPLLLFLVVAGATSFLWTRTVVGRHLFALGSNREAARFAGVATARLEILAYVACSLLAGLAGCLFVLDVNSAQASSFGNFYELYAIAGAVLGGVALRGGEGTVLGVVLVDKERIVRLSRGAPWDLELVESVDGRIGRRSGVSESTIHRIIATDVDGDGGDDLLLCDDRRHQLTALLRRPAGSSSPAPASRSIRHSARRGSTRVSGPGQKAAAKARARSSAITSANALSASGKWQINGLKCGRPLASNTAATARPLRASAPSP